jgi:hypothetical protein
VPVPEHDGDLTSTAAMDSPQLSLDFLRVEVERTDDGAQRAIERSLRILRVEGQVVPDVVNAEVRATDFRDSLGWNRRSLAASASTPSVGLSSEPSPHAAAETPTMARMTAFIVEPPLDAFTTAYMYSSLGKCAQGITSYHAK